MSRGLRILILLAVLALVAGMTFAERLWVRGHWRALDVAIYPVAMDAGAAAYVAQLREEDFQEIGRYLAGEAERRRKKSLAAPRIRLMAPLPRPPVVDPARSALEAIQTSLRLRWYAFRHTPFWASLGGIRLFVLYHEVKYDQPLPHSLGLQKGLIGVVHVFASDEQRAQNQIVITHELLHTLGATDKYGASGQPSYPFGYADPYAEPRHPQYQAEIMAGRIPVSADRAEMPKDLGETTIGHLTASEIGW